MVHEVLKEMEKALGKNKTLETLTIGDDHDSYYEDYESHKKFCRHLVCGIGQNTSLSEVDLNFASIDWDCLDGRLVYQSHVV